MSSRDGPRTAILCERVENDGANDDQAAKYRPVGRLFAIEKIDPNRIEKRFYETDYGCIQRPCTAGNAFNKQDIGDADLYYPKEGRAAEISGS